MLVTLIALGLPAVAAIRSAVLAQPAPAGVGGAMLPTGVIDDGLVALRTALIPLAIGVLATVWAWPAAWLIRAGGRRARWACVLGVLPLLLPSYLAFAGWRLVHAPGTWLGDLFAQSAPWVQVAVDRGLAVVGLSLWAAPIALLILSSGLGRVPGGALEHLRLDGAGRRARAWHTLRMSMAPIVMSVLAVALVMLGSAVPLHLAQIDTLAQRLWWRLQLADTGRIWIDAWPLAFLAALASWLCVRRLSARPPESDSTPVHAGAPGVAGLVFVLTLGVVAPLALYAFSLRSWSSVPAFWRDLGPAALASGALAAVVGLAAALLGALTWWLASARPDFRPSRPLALMLACWVAAGLLPGVLVGHAVSTAWSIPWLADIGDWLDRFDGRVALAHLARFGFVGVLAGYWLARQEPRDMRDARHLDGAIGLRAWLRAGLGGRAGALAGVGVAMWALSLHEIEAAVIVSAPGTPSLPQRLLDLLHYNRDEQLAAAAVNLVGVGAAGALLAGWLVARSLRGRR